MGTRFVATRESQWSDKRKTNLLAGQADNTLQSRLLDTLGDPAWPHEFPARFLRNETSELWAGKEAELEAVAVSEPARYQQIPMDDVTKRLQLAREGVDLVEDIPSARDIVERTVAQAIAVLRASSGQIRDCGQGDYRRQPPPLPRCGRGRRA